MRVASRWMAGVTVLLLAACGQTVAPADQDSTQAGTDDAGTDDALDDTSADTVATDDVAADAPDDVTAEVASEVVDDVPDAVAGACVIDDDCADKVKLSPCQVPKCTIGVCSAVKNPDACCLDADCDDGNECNTHKCDQLQHKCSNSAIANCCSGKVLLQDATFEAGQDGFVATDGAQNGDVGWQQSTWRAHGGKKSLYFGNSCHTYDTSMTAGACKPQLGAAKPVSTTLVSKSYLLPNDKKAQAHFWLWLDTEPSYAKTMPLGTCDPPCNAASTCIQVAGASVCEPEKDVLSLQVLAQDVSSPPVFWSTQIGKSTLNDPQNPGGWRHIAVDLAQWQGKTIQLAWQFNTKTNTNNDYEGIYLDDIVVETICPDLGKILCGDTQICDDDGLTCTAETCTGYSNVPGHGVCFHDAIAACCLGDADCDDGNACTLDTCVQNVCASQPDASKAGCCTPSVLFADNFDAPPLTNWVDLEDNSVNVFWRANPKGGNPGAGTTGGGGSLYFGNATFSNYEDTSLQPGEGARGVACAKLIPLKAGTNYKLLSFDLNLETEWSDVPAAQYVNPPIPGNAKLDWFSVEVRAGIDSTTVWSSDAIAGTTSGKWLPVTVSLDAWSGKSIQVCVRFDAGDDVLNDKPGANIDNLSVYQACQKAECYGDSDCAQKACGACQKGVCSTSACVCAAVSNCP